jgi:uncharacterized phiE125 gp8 family phage protein
MALPTLDETKAQLRVRHALEDALITGYMGFAVSVFETISRRILTAKSMVEYFDKLPAVIDLTAGPVTAIGSITARTADGTVTIDPSCYIAHCGPNLRRPGVSFKQMATLPQVDGYHSSVAVNFTAETNPIPDDIKYGLLSMIGQFYEFRVDIMTAQINELPMGARAVAMAHRWSAYR